MRLKGMLKSGIPFFVMIHLCLVKTRIWIFPIAKNIFAFRGELFSCSFVLQTHTHENSRNLLLNYPAFYWSAVTKTTTQEVSQSMMVHASPDRLYSFGGLTAVFRRNIRI
jgi:hypothetical protein